MGYGQESVQAGIQDNKNVGGRKCMTKPPQKFFIYKFRRPTSSTFQKALDDSCAIIGFHFIDERVPKKCYFLAILVDNFYESFFQSHLKNIFIIGMMQNCTYMFKASLIFRKKKLKKNSLTLFLCS